MRELSDEQTDKIRFLEQRGFKRWKKGKLDRLYIDARELGLVIDYDYGKPVHATLNGADISVTDAVLLREAKTFIPIPSGEAVSDDVRLAELAQRKFDAVWRR